MSLHLFAQNGENHIFGATTSVGISTEIVPLHFVRILYVKVGNDSVGNPLFYQGILRHTKMLYLRLFSRGATPDECMTIGK